MPTQCMLATISIFFYLLGECPLSRIRQTLFRMKASLFSNSNDEVAYNSAVLKNFIRAVIGRDLRMSDISTPRYNE